MLRRGLRSWYESEVAMLTEQQMIERIHAMNDPAEVEKQLEEVRKTYREVTSHVRSELAVVRELTNSSSLFTREDLNDEVKELEPATKLQMMLAHCERELIKRKEELTGNTRTRPG
jgi:hypothetical protein